MRRCPFLALIVIALLSFNVFSNCTCTLAATTSSVPDSGSLDGSTYFNTYFGLSMKIPSDWQVQNKETLEQIKGQGQELIAGDDQNMKALLEKAKQDTIVLITIFQYPLGSPVPYNPNLVAVAEKVGLYPGIQTGSDYLYNAKKLLQNSQLKYNFDKDIYSVKFDNKTFYVMEVSIKYGKEVIKQNYYSTIIKDYAVSFVIGYATNEQLNSLTNILKSAKFSD